MLPAMLPAVLAVILALLPGTGTYVVDVYEASGTHVSAPIFVNYNLTWQFNMTIVAETGAVIVPLFSNRTQQAGMASFDRTRCTGFASVCCLYELSAFYLNEELAAYLEHLGPCTAHHRASDTLHALPPVHAFATMAFERQYGVYPRVWAAGGNTYTVEILAEMLPLPWLSRDMERTQTVVHQDVVDREVQVSFAFVQPTATTKVQLYLTDHHLIFSDATRNIDDNVNFLHKSFYHTCSDHKKPEFSLWRADIIATNESCVWFCLSGYHLFPSATDYYHTHIDPQSKAHRACVPVPVYGAESVMQVTVNLTGSNLTAIAGTSGTAPGTSEREQHERYAAAVMIGMQAALAENNRVPRQRSTFYLQRVATHGDTSEFQFSAVFYTVDYVNNATAQEEFLLNRTNSSIGEAALLEALNAALFDFAGQPGAVDSVQISVLSVRTVMRWPPYHEAVPLRDIVLVSIWAVLLLMTCCYSARKVYQHLRRRRYSRTQRPSPLMTRAFGA